MTLIMVTHDVYLKNFADRVIYMRDGKIAKQEIIPIDIKKKTLEDLDNRINEVSNIKWYCLLLLFFFFFFFFLIKKKKLYFLLKIITIINKI